MHNLSRYCTSVRLGFQTTDNPSPNRATSMKDKVKPSHILNTTFEDFVQGRQLSENLLGDLLRLGAQQILKQASVVEVDEFMGRSWYARGPAVLVHHCYRNVYTPFTLKSHGLIQTLLVVIDGGKELVSAISECFPLADLGRCVARKLRDWVWKFLHDCTVAKPFRTRAKSVYYVNDYGSGHGLAMAFIYQYGQAYPSMPNCFQQDLHACLVHLNYPNGHNLHPRTTNLMERIFLEQKRSTKVIPNHVHEHPAMKLVYGTLIRAAQQYRRLGMDKANLVLIKTRRYKLCHQHNVNYHESRITILLAA
jgi:hypothetical protein